MPQVPIEQNRVGIADVTDAKLRPADYSGTGLQALGAGVHDVGTGIGEVAKVADEHRQTLEVAGAKMLDAGLMNATLQQGEQFKALTGTAATNGLDAHLSALDKIGQDTLAQATSPRMRRLIEPVVAERIATARASAMDHSRTQAASALEDATTARLDATRSTALAARTPEEFETNIATGMADVQHFWTGQGRDAIVGQQKAQAWASSVLTARAGNLIDTNHVDEAAAFIDKHRGDFTGDDLDKVTGALAPIVRDRTLEAKADAIMGVANPDGSSANFTAPLRDAGHAPVPGGQYGAARDYGQHHGVDQPAPIGTPVYSGHGPGTATVTHSALGGNIVEVHHADGYTTKYMHLGKVAVQNGDQVDANTVLGGVGITGRSTGPHLHYEVRAPDGKPVDPGQVATAIRQGPTRENLEAMLGAVDRDPSLTPEDRTALKAKIMQRVGISDHIRERGFQDADERFSQWLVAQPPGSFTDANKIPRSIWSAMKPSQQVEAQRAAETNARAQVDAVKPNGAAAVLLHRLQYENPAGFAQTNLEMYRGAVSRSEFDEMSSEQAKIRAQPREGAKYSQIFDTIRTWGGGVADTRPKGPKESDSDYQTRNGNAVALANEMRRYLNQVQTFDPNHKYTEDDFRRAYNSATLRTYQPDGSFKYRYQMGYDQPVGMSQADEARIRAQLAAQHLPVTDDNIRRVHLLAATSPGQ